MATTGGLPHVAAYVRDAPLLRRMLYCIGRRYPAARSIPSARGNARTWGRRKAVTGPGWGVQTRPFALPEKSRPCSSTPGALTRGPVGEMGRRRMPSARVRALLRCVAELLPTVVRTDAVVGSEVATATPAPSCDPPRRRNGRTAGRSAWARRHTAPRSCTRRRRAPRCRSGTPPAIRRTPLAIPDLANPQSPLERGLSPTA